MWGLDTSTKPQLGTTLPDTPAEVALFALNIQEWHPQWHVDVLTGYGTSNDPQWVCVVWNRWGA
ncbi:hypothetical protein BJ987_000923 [Nocardia goodfellowii]|uniref:Uncharacterized protein n=1 Tax=Nocardia goodfellowii TaxID=882446 RepID=A0ABS4Q8N8_9NOCA|nr:hypothetical protein [Nocardia goodfellowii]